MCQPAVFCRARCSLGDTGCCYGMARLPSATGNELGQSMPDARRLEDLTWVQVDDYLQQFDAIIIPIGAVEQHAFSCPLGTDTILAKHIAERVGESTGLLVGPCIPIGDSLAHGGFPGTISLRPSTLMAVVRDYVSSLHRAGFRRFLLLGTHWDNHFPVAAAMSEVADDCDGIRFIVQDFWEFDAVRSIMKEEFGERGGHADATDVSLLLAICERLVDRSALTSEFPPVNYQVGRRLTREWLTRSGVIGSDQTKASIAAGERLLAAVVTGYSAAVADLLK